MVFIEATKKFTRLNRYLAQLPVLNLDNLDERWLSVAGQLAMTSVHPKDQVGAVIYSRGKMIAQGVNENKTHPYKAKHHPHKACGRTHQCTLHAEISAIISALRMSDVDFEKTSIAVARLRKGSPACSYPCDMCWPVMEKIGIRHIVCYDFNKQPVSIQA